MTSKYFKTFKEKFFTLFILETLFIFINFFFLLFVKTQIKTFLDLFNAYTPQIQQLGAALQDSAANLAPLQDVANLLAPLALKVLILAYIITPVLFLLSYSVFQSLIWKNINNIKSYKKYFLGFSLFTLLNTLILYLTLFLLWSQINISTFEFSPNLVFFPVIFIIITYFSLVFHKIYKDNFKEAFKNTFIQGIKKFSSFILPFALHLLILIFLIFSFLSLFLNYTVPDHWPINTSINLIFIFLAIILTILSKVYSSIKV